MFIDVSLHIMIVLRKGPVKTSNFPDCYITEGMIVTRIDNLELMNIRKFHWWDTAMDLTSKLREKINSCRLLLAGNRLMFSSPDEIQS